MKFITRRTKVVRPKLPKEEALHLPKDYPWKVLSQLTADLKIHLIDDEYKLLSQIIRDRDIAAYNLLTDEWGLQSINCNSTHCTDTLAQIRTKYQLSSLLKKFQFDTDRQARVDSAKTKLKIAEDKCWAFNQLGYRGLVANGERPACILTHAQSFLRKLLGDTSPTDSIVTEWSRHGPGSNLDTLEGQSDLYNKFGNWPYSCTSAALPYARYLISTDSRWLGALEDDYRRQFGIQPNIILNQREFWKRVIQIVPGNRICFVPKNAQTERSIAIEPALNLMLQLGVDGYIRKRLKRWDIDLDSQEKNQTMARLGSLSDDDDSFVTLDMSMASDTISLKLCELLLPRCWYDYLCKLRSPQGHLDGETICYQKISSMGNGYTFALESAIFAAICSAAIIYDKGTIDYKTELCVFGDDLIVPKKHGSSCLSALQICGFSLNVEKSFFSGPIRESCGCDWYKGKQLRPVFLSTSPTKITELFNDYNRLNRILNLRWGEEDSKTCALIERWIPIGFRGFTGPFSDEDFDSYIHRNLLRSDCNGLHNIMYVYKRLLVKPRRLSANSFLFRKIMHDLKPVGSQGSFLSKKRKLAVGGSRFSVTSPKGAALSSCYSHTSHWCDQYTEVATG